MAAIKYRPADVDGFKIFYREAGAMGAPKLLLLHGFPSASHMFATSSRFSPTASTSSLRTSPASETRVCQGVGIASTGSRRRSISSRKSWAWIVTPFTSSTTAPRLGFGSRQSIPMDYCDYLAERQRLRGGAERRLNLVGPTGRIRPRPTARRCARSSSLRPPSGNTRMACRTGRRCRQTDIRSTTFISPEPGRRMCSSTSSATTRATSRSTRPSRPTSGPTNRACSRFGARTTRSFLPPGAEAFKRDIPDAVVRFLDTGHFALETHAGEIAAAIRGFLPG